MLSFDNLFNNLLGFKFCMNDIRIFRDYKADKLYSYCDEITSRDDCAPLLLKNKDTVEMLSLYQNNNLMMVVKMFQNICYKS